MSVEIGFTNKKNEIPRRKGEGKWIEGKARKGCDGLAREGD